MEDQNNAANNDKGKVKRMKLTKKGRRKVEKLLRESRRKDKRRKR